MTLDDKGREDVVAFLHANGYNGTLAEWWAEVRRQSYYSEVRIAQSIWVQSLGSEYKPAQKFINRILDVATPHFDAITSYTDWKLQFNLYKKAARRRETPSRPLRLSGVSITIECDDTHIDVRIIVEVDTEYRREWNIYFKPGQEGQLVT